MRETSQIRVFVEDRDEISAISAAKHTTQAGVIERLLEIRQRLNAVAKKRGMDIDVLLHELEQGEK